jgi:prevent-host-death family protein
MKVELVTNLKRHATELIADLQESRDPVMITQHGKPAAILLDLETYESLNRKISVLEGIALGERAIREGRTINQEEAKKRLSKWLK